MKPLVAILFEGTAWAARSDNPKVPHFYESRLFCISSGRRSERKQHRPIKC